MTLFAVAAPVRLQLSRRKGFDLQAWSREVNGLAAVNVARPSKWGNPYKIGPAIDVGGVKAPALDAAACVHLFHEHWRGLLRGAYAEQRYAMLREIAGYNLACWCEPGQPCHADVLLEVANG